MMGLKGEGSCLAPDQETGRAGHLAQGHPVEALSQLTASLDTSPDTIKWLTTEMPQR